MNSHILLINNNPPYSGVGRYAYSLYNAFQRLGASHIDFISWDKLLFDRVFQALKPLRFHWLYYMMKIKLLAEKLRVDKNLIHITNSGYLASIIPSIKRRNGRIVASVRDTIPMGLRDDLAHQRAGKATANVLLADYVICVSNYTKENLSNFLGADLENVTVIPNGVDHSLFRPRSKIEVRKRLNLPLDKSIILNVGSAEPRKNVPVLIKTLYELLKDEPNCILVRIGERSSKESSMIKSLRLDDKVFYRKAPSEEVALYYNAADLLVHPAYYEDFGNPPLEALASGCPVVASNKGAIPEVVSDAALLLDPFDVDGFVYWIREVLTNEDLRAKLSKKGLERSMNFSWEKCARETLKVYEKVLEEV